MEPVTIVCAVAALIAGSGAGYALNRHVSAKRIGDAEELATRIVEEARKEAQAQ